MERDLEDKYLPTTHQRCFWSECFTILTERKENVKIKPFSHLLWTPSPPHLTPGKPDTDEMQANGVERIGGHCLDPAFPKAGCNAAMLRDDWLIRALAPSVDPPIGEFRIQS